MKKIFSKIIITTIFAFAIMILSSHYSEAAVTASIWASTTSPKVGDYVTISWSSEGADSCSNSFNSSTATSGDYTYKASSVGSQTFTVHCRHLVVVNSCDTYGGECSSKFTNDTICYTLATKSQCQSNSSCQWLTCAIR